MTGLSRPHEPGPPDAAEWDKAAITFATEQLTRVRASATAWTGTVGTLLGLFGAVAVVGGGTTKLADVPDPALRWVIVGLVAVAGALAGISVVTGVRAAQGASLRTSDNWSGSAYRAAVVSNTADALDWLRWARWTGLGAALTVFSIGLLGLISVAAQPSKLGHLDRRRRRPGRHGPLRFDRPHRRRAAHRERHPGGKRPRHHPGHRLPGLLTLRVPPAVGAAADLVVPPAVRLAVVQDPLDVAEVGVGSARRGPPAAVPDRTPRRRDRTARTARARPPRCSARGPARSGSTRITQCPDSRTLPRAQRTPSAFVSNRTTSPCATPSWRNGTFSTRAVSAVNSVAHRPSVSYGSHPSRGANLNQILTAPRAGALVHVGRGGHAVHPPPPMAPA
nr:hypothetical protein GCM10020092_059900 [Actinoplanes digitatis]